MHVIELAILVILTVLFGLAIIWEVHDGYRFTGLDSVYEIEDPSIREEASEFYGCFMHKDRVIWRPIYIATMMASLIAICILYYLFTVRTSVLMFLAVFVSIFAPFYTVESFKSYHLYMELCNNSRHRKPFFV